MLLGDVVAGRLEVGAGLAFLVLIAFLRRGAMTFAAFSLLCIVVFVITVVGLDPQRGFLIAILTPPALAIPVALTGTILHWQAVPVFTLLTVGDAFWLCQAGIPQLVAYRAEHPSDVLLFMVTTMLILVAIGALGTFSARQIERSLSHLRQRNEALEAANINLAAQWTREQDVSEEIDSLSEQLAAVSTRQGLGVATQAGAIGEVARAVTALHAAADRIAENATEVRRAAETALHTVRAAQTRVMESRQAVERNRHEVQAVVERLTALTRVMGSLTQFMQAIRGLSEETHLLALNARIEAAGAGEHGRRFAVVAGEVENLAAHSNKIVDQIEALLDQLREASTIVLLSTESSIAVAVEVEAQSTQIQDAQTQVVQVVQHTSALAERITEGTLQQRSATEQMTQTMQQIAQVADTTGHDTSALEQVIQELVTTAHLLHTAVHTQLAEAA
jgi:methyl-accepting chemotaxis protein